MAGVPEEIITVSEESEGLLGWVVIDTTVRGQSSGGLRMHPALTEPELRDLARTMTLKYGFLGMPKGGAKAGIRFDPEKDRAEALRLLGLFGKAIRPIIESRRFLPGPDVGTGAREITHLFRECGAPFREEELWSYEDSGGHTAAGVVEAYRRVAARLSIPPEESTVVIEGSGAVGNAVFRKLTAMGVRVAALSNRFGWIFNPNGIDGPAWTSFLASCGPEEITRFPGAEEVTREEALRFPAAAFLPCALSHTIGEKEAAWLVAKVVVPGANNPWTPQARLRLESRGILLLPDFVVNSGGVLGGALQHGGLSREEAERKVADLVGRAVDVLLEKAESLSLSPIVLAEEASTRRFRAMRNAPSSRILLALLAMKRRGLIPSTLGPFLARRFAARLGRGIARF